MVTAYSHMLGCRQTQNTIYYFLLSHIRHRVKRNFIYPTPDAAPCPIGGAKKDPCGNIRASFSAKGEIDRKDFGLKWNKVLESGGVLVERECGHFFG